MAGEQPQKYPETRIGQSKLVNQNLSLGEAKFIPTDKKNALERGIPVKIPVADIRKIQLGSHVSLEFVEDRKGRVGLKFSLEKAEAEHPIFIEENERVVIGSQIEEGNVMQHIMPYVGPKIAAGNISVQYGETTTPSPVPFTKISIPGGTELGLSRAHVAIMVKKDPTGKPWLIIEDLHSTQQTRVEQIEKTVSPEVEESFFPFSPTWNVHIEPTPENRRQIINIGAASTASLLHRERNEDAIVANEATGDVIVNDGVGGMQKKVGDIHYYGDVASRLSAIHIFNELKRLPTNSSISDTLRGLVNALKSANQNFIGPDLNGLQTTSTAYRIVNDTLVWAASGDTPLLVYREIKGKPQIIQVTEDQSLLRNAYRGPDGAHMERFVAIPENPEEKAQIDPERIEKTRQLLDACKTLGVTVNIEDILGRNGRISKGILIKFPQDDNGKRLHKDLVYALSNQEDITIFAEGTETKNKARFGRKKAIANAFQTLATAFYDMRNITVGGLGRSSDNLLIDSGTFHLEPGDVVVGLTDGIYPDNLRGQVLAQAIHDARQRHGSLNAQASYVLEQTLLFATNTSIPEKVRKMDDFSITLTEKAA